MDLLKKITIQIKTELKLLAPRIKLLFKFNGKLNDDSDIKRIYSFIGGLIIFIALILYLGGLGSDKLNSQLKDRYEKATGTIIRIISSEDSRNYQDLKKLALLSKILKSSGCFFFILGLIILIKPELLHYEFKRIGFIKGR